MAVIMHFSLELPHVVIVGAGFGGLAAAQCLQDKPQFRVTIIDRHNYHLFQPLLYQVACATLSPDDVAVPIRSIFRKSPHIHVIMDEVTAISPKAKQIMTSGQVLAYDYLILAPGSEDNYFGNHTVAEHTYSLKSLEDATNIRQSVLMAFEKAEITQDPAEKKSLTTFVLIGGGPTGVEMAGALAELSAMLSSEFHHLPSTTAHIVLLEAGPHILASFPEDISHKAETSLRARGVEIRLNTKVTSVNSEGVTTEKDFIPASTVIWTAGVKARPLHTWFDVPLNTGKGERVYVRSDLSLPDFPTVFIIGDAAAVKDRSGGFLPGLASVAKQQGIFVAHSIMRHIKGDSRPRIFRYKNYGTLATIGHYSAIADFGKIHLSGVTGWIVWVTAHIYYLIGFRNRAIVLIKWLFEYIAHARSNRLIIKEFSPSKEDS